MYRVDFQIELEGVSVPEARLAQAITHVLDLHDLDPESALTVVVTDDEAVRILNQKFREVDAPTDILSFPADPLPELPDDLEIDLDEEESAAYLGDLIIAYPYTQQQAAAAGHALEDELTLLVVHGTLHLLGYDHDTPEHEAEMWETQAETLAALNVPITVPRFHPGENN
jgi:probable rRNA maturation factor